MKESEKPGRALGPAVRNGLRTKCPRCGEGDLLRGYLKVRDHCPVCDLELYHQRADDGPAYLTMLLVGHIAGFALHLSWVLWRPEPLSLFLGIGTLSAVIAAILLPRMKGLIISYQYAKHLHGF